MDEAIVLSEFILKKRPLSEFKEVFKNKFSPNFDPEKDLEAIGVINQTTMLATETMAISNFLKEVMAQKDNTEDTKNMANTRDTLCYATNENQDATYGLLKTKADLAIVVGGYNSSNTSHLVELCEEQLTTYYICNSGEIKNKNDIQHFNYKDNEMMYTKNFLPKKEVVDILLTSGASCPDAIIEEVLFTLLDCFQNTKNTKDMLEMIKAEV